MASQLKSGSHFYKCIMGWTFEPRYNYDHQSKRGLSFFTYLTKIINRANKKLGTFLENNLDNSKIIAKVVT